MTRFLYSQRTGVLTGPDGKVWAKGYSGHGEGLNNPAKESVQAVGPIPRGDWEIGAPYDSKNVGPFALPLTPKGHDALGRSAFRIHGDNRKGDRSASHGCIIVPRDIRNRIRASGVSMLRVVE